MNFISEMLQKTHLQIYTPSTFVPKRYSMLLFFGLISLSFVPVCSMPPKRSARPTNSALTIQDHSKKPRAKYNKPTQQQIIQELQEKIGTLENESTAQKRKINDLEKELTTIRLILSSQMATRTQVAAIGRNVNAIQHKLNASNPINITPYSAMTSMTSMDSSVEEEEEPSHLPAHPVQHSFAVNSSQDSSLFLNNSGTNYD